MEIKKLLDEETKICPECAETIKFKAKKCRFCQAQFDSEEVAGQVETRRAELLSKEREGKIQCPQCEYWDVHKAFLADGSYSDYCPHCKKSLKYMGAVEEKKPLPPKKPSALGNVLYILVCITVAGILFTCIIFPEPKDALHLSVWIGIFTAWTAKRHGKSGWLWFFIGFIGIGFTTIFIINIFTGYFGAYNQPVNVKLRELEHFSLHKLHKITNSLEAIEDVNSIQNINKAIKLNELSQNEIFRLEKAFVKSKTIVNEYKDEIKKRGDEYLNLVIEIMEINDKIGTLNHLKAYKDYLDAYKKMLIFSRDNYDAIMNRKEPETEKYDALYSHYKSTWSKMNDATLQKQRALKEYLAKHPEHINFLQQSQKRLENTGN